MKPLSVLLVLAIVASGCASKPTLEPRRGGNPEQVDLSGQWLLRAGGEVPVSDEQTIRIPPAAARRETTVQRPNRPRRSKGSSVRLFLESGQSLKISQTDYGLFISFDRAIVEEYTFGENRGISIGPVHAQRVSGWDGPTFIVETMDDEGSVLTERWYLEGRTLQRDLTIREGDDILFTRRQVFDPE